MEQIQAEWSVERVGLDKIQAVIFCRLADYPPVIIHQLPQSASRMGYVFARRDAKMTVRALTTRM